MGHCGSHKHCEIIKRSRKRGKKSVNADTLCFVTGHGHMVFVVCIVVDSKWFSWTTMCVPLFYLCQRQSEIYCVYKIRGFSHRLICLTCCVSQICWIFCPLTANGPIAFTRTLAVSLCFNSITSNLIALSALRRSSYTRDLNQIHFDRLMLSVDVAIV